MKITSSGLNSANIDLQKTDKNKNNLEQMDSANGNKKDYSESAKVNVSQHAKDIQKIKEMATNTPDVDQEKVAKFKDLINSGQYKIDAQGIADKLINEELTVASLEKN